MTFVSDGAHVKGLNLVGDWSTGFRGSGSVQLGDRWASYGEIYRKQLWVFVVVRKLAVAEARLPLVAYSRSAGSRDRVPDHPFAQLLSRPNRRDDPFRFKSWTSATQSVYGEAFWGKIRDAGGRPVELVRLHPSGMRIKEETTDGRRVWEFSNSRIHLRDIPEEDLVHFSDYNPDDDSRGMSPLEPLRATLENEDAARRATSAFWRSGARPATVLTHPGSLSSEAHDRLRLQWSSLHAGADNTGATAVLEEGLKPERVMLTAEEAQYIETRKLNREETCGAYDVPPPVVHILDHATFSNITEQMRSMYRDTMAPRLGSRESVIETQLRASRRPGSDEPDFGDEIYAEYLLDEVLRGDFEVRMDAYTKGINSGIFMPNEVRARENLPNAGAEANRLFVSSGLVPMETQNGLVPAGGQPVKVFAFTRDEVRSLMGRLSRAGTVDDIDVDSLAQPGSQAHQLLVELARDAADLADFKGKIKHCEEAS